MTDDANEPSPAGTERTPPRGKLDLLVGLCALATSVISIWLAISQGDDMERLVQAQSWPFLVSTRATRSARRRVPRRRCLMWNRVLAAGFALAACAAQAGDAPQAPERRVQGNTLTSKREPAVTIEVPAAARYAGADRFVLYDLADCELHAFVEADGEQRVQHLYWLQFERYLDSRPELHHTYDSPRHATLGGRDFYVDTWLDAEGDEHTPGSDGEHIRALIRAQGYVVQPNRMSVRLVHLLDEAKRKELMLIYSEDLASTGYTPAELRKGGKRHGEWPALERALVERALARFALRFEGEAR